jgi:hypothetical protein
VKYEGNPKGLSGQHNNTPPDRSLLPSSRVQPALQQFSLLQLSHLAIGFALVLEGEHRYPQVFDVDPAREPSQIWWAIPRAIGIALGNVTHHLHADTGELERSNVRAHRAGIPEVDRLDDRANRCAIS